MSAILPLLDQPRPNILRKEIRTPIKFCGGMGEGVIHLMRDAFGNLRSISIDASEMHLPEEVRLKLKMMEVRLNRLIETHEAFLAEVRFLAHLDKRALDRDLATALVRMIFVDLSQS